MYNHIDLENISQFYMSVLFQYTHSMSPIHPVPYRLFPRTLPGYDLGAAYGIQDATALMKLIQTDC